MKLLKPTLLAGIIGIASTPACLLAQTQPKSAGTASTAAASEMSDAEVRKVDKENKKVTLKHGAIKSLDMPPMTMVFQVKEASLLDNLQAGDKVRFQAVNEAGKLTVTEIQPLK